MVWYGMVWYGTIWYGMVWYGNVVCGRVSLHLVGHGEVAVGRGLAAAVADLLGDGQLLLVVLDGLLVEAHRGVGVPDVPEGPGGGLRLVSKPISKKEQTNKISSN